MSRGRLLVLDDDETVGSLLLFVARSVDFEARLCSAASACLEILTAWRPTHLAIDLSMPGIDGLEALRQLAAGACTAKIIICSGAGRGEVEAALREAQALGLQTAGILAKPFSVTSLRALLV